jgi:hypothetical protein
MRGALDGGKISVARAAIVVLAGTESKEDLGWVANALTSAKEFKEENLEVTVIFDGAGTKRIGVLSDPDHKYTRKEGWSAVRVRSSALFFALR